MTTTYTLARTLALALFLTVAPTTAGLNEDAPAAAVLADIGQATWVTEGKGRRAVYVFFDPNCPACLALYQNLRSFLASHDLQLRWIPVAVVNATSPGKSAAILQAPDPVAALHRNKERYNTGTYSGGIEEDIPTTATEQKLRANLLLLNRLDIPVVPTMLFAGKDRRTMIIQGALSPVALHKVFARLP